MKIAGSNVKVAYQDKERVCNRLNNKKLISMLRSCILLRVLSLLWSRSSAQLRSIFARSRYLEPTKFLGKVVYQCHG